VLSFWPGLGLALAYTAVVGVAGTAVIKRADVA
jgi:hypothetical protein